MVRLEFILNNALLREIDSDQEEITIGRGDENDIQIKNMAVSGSHAKIVNAKGNYYIVDLASTNGTFVNEKRVFKQVLKEGDRITIGKHTLAVSFKKRSETGEVSTGALEKTYKLKTKEIKEILDKKSK